jgi:hypothetical protein
VRNLLEDRDVSIVIHNGAQFDCLCMLAWLDCTELLFAALDSGRIVDTMIVERIAEIGRQTSRKDLSLVSLCRAHGIEPPRKDETQTSYEPLYGAPLSEYTPRQVEYALEDSLKHLELFERQEKRWIRNGAVNMSDVAFLVRKQFALGLTRTWGIRLDAQRVGSLEVAVRDHLSELRATAVEAGLVASHWDIPKSAKGFENLNTRWLAHLDRLIAGDVDEPFDTFRISAEKAGCRLICENRKDTKRIKRWVANACAGPDGKGVVPQTKKPRDWKPSKKRPEYVTNVSIARATLEDSGDPILAEFAEYGEWLSVESKDLVIFREHLHSPIHTRFGLADTIRSTSSKPNTQNQRRDRPGRPSVRECFQARPGYVLYAIDHVGLELCTLAEFCASKLNLWDMAGKIIARKDLHSVIGAAILRMTYADFVTELDAKSYRAKNARGNGKVVNFGCPGGMSFTTLKLYAKQNYGIDLTLVQAKQLVDLWREVNPDGVAFLEYVGRLPKDIHGIIVTIPGTTIVRRGCTYCSACNTHFQGLGAALEGHLAYQIEREAHLGYAPDGKISPLIHSRPWNYVHDEFIREVEEEYVTDVHYRMQEIMIEGAKGYLRHVPIKAEGTAMRRWSKNAYSQIENGRLTIWDSKA